MPPAAVAASLAAAVLVGGCTAIDRVPLRADVFGTRVQTTVDRPIAAYYAQAHLAAVPVAQREPQWDGAINAIHASLGERLPSEAELREWSETYSVDFAALVLARQLEQRARADGFVAHWRMQIADMRRTDADGRLASVAVPQDVVYLFVPGWMYLSDPGSGADFAATRRLLARHGGRVEVAPVLDNGSVEANAALLAAHLRQLAGRGERVVLVSGSKGGPEAALALASLHEKREGGHVLAWVNIVGLLQGTALADLGTRWPACWWVELAVLPDGSFEGIRSLTTSRSAVRAQRIDLPPHLLVVNYLGLPLSGQVSQRARIGYRLLREFGPNDGLTTIRSLIAEHGVTIAEFGTDHFMAAADIDLRILALARAVHDHTRATGAAVARLGSFR